MRLFPLALIAEFFHALLKVNPKTDGSDPSLTTVCNAERKITVKRYPILFAAALSSFVVFHCGAQGTAFTYQGRLDNNGAPANGSYDLQFILFNVSQFGFPAGPILTK